jgi:glutamate dehydrogenase (NAD(P)+)
MISNILKRNLSLFSPLRYSFASGASFLSTVESFFDRAAVHTGIRTDRLNFYKKAENIVKCSIPLIRGIYLVDLDDGSIETISAYRCQHKTHKLPTKGGTRYA